MSINGKNVLLETTFYSPVAAAIMPEWAPHDFISYPTASNKSIYRQDPSPEVDAAWDRIADLGVIPLTRDQVKGLGKDPSTVLTAPADWGLEDESYLGQLDGIHLLHCLNSMRKSLYYNYDYYFPHGHSYAYRVHLSHCQEALTQWLMCQPSLEIIVFEWIEKHEKPFPDFDITRKCWDFEQLLEWQDAKRALSVNSATWNALRIPDDVVPGPSPVLNNEVLNVTFGDLGVRPRPSPLQ
ncbi:hypothetical protein BX600DRAFT_510245 [Xylariales sp. PMI_506]|nr:hypothetical protein BX600DRAFT_510245 [Xylariales sp. PMI_506]